MALLTSIALIPIAAVMQAVRLHAACNARRHGESSAAEVVDEGTKLAGALQAVLVSKYLVGSISPEKGIPRSYHLRSYYLLSYYSLLTTSSLTTHYIELQAVLATLGLLFGLGGMAEEAKEQRRAPLFQTPRAGGNSQVRNASRHVYLLRTTHCLLLNAHY